MFWTELVRQQNLFSEDEPIGSATVAHLIRKAVEIFPSDDQEVYRRFAFLTHVSTQKFLRPMLEKRYGTLDAAKEPTLQWLDELGSLETFARSTRGDKCDGRSASCNRRPLPAWYTQYLQTDHWKDTKSRAESLWLSSTMNDGIRCSLNRRHDHECWHHSDYGRCGEADEFRMIVPLCDECHSKLGFRGPAVPQEIPEGVKKWL